MRCFALILTSILLLALTIGQGCPPSGKTLDDTTAPATMGGAVNVSNLSVPAGQTTKVTSDLTINATGNVTISGQLVADPATAMGGKGSSITIIAQGSITVDGIVQAGDGASADGVSMSSIAANGDDEHDPSGGDGGNVELDAAGNLTIGIGASIIAGSGGGGAQGQWGGNGGIGGDLRLGAGDTLTVNGIVTIGNGGEGGDITSLGDILPDASLGGAGGDSGTLYVKAGTVNWTGYDAQEQSLGYEGAGMFLGGLGGNASLLTIVTDVSTGALTAADASANVRPAAYLSSYCPPSGCSFKAADGGDGFFVGGQGGNMTVAITQRAEDEHDGPTVTVRAGNGGNLISRVDPKYGQSVTAIGAQAGAGGIANATAPAGHDGDDAYRDGGFGGTAIAYGGNGGSGAINRLQSGGEGGAAYAYAGIGGDGISGCYRIGDGGAGGIANAYGGNGGSAGFAGEGGEAYAIAGQGGSGGDGGKTPGAGAKGGNAVAEPGQPGTYNPAFYAVPPILGAVGHATPGQSGVNGVANVYSETPTDNSCPDMAP